MCLAFLKGKPNLFVPKRNEAVSESESIILIHAFVTRTPLYITPEPHVPF